MKRNKRGFTLIELLAVIVILAIIALIATPIILDIIKDSKESAIKQNAVSMASVAEKKCMSLEMNKENRAFRVEYEDGKEITGEGLSSLEGTFKGDNPSYGQIDVNDKCDVAMALYDNSTQLCVYKEYNNDKILSVKTSKKDTCNVDNIKEGIFPLPDEDNESSGSDDDINGDEVVVIPPIDVGFSCGETNPEDVDPTLFTYTDNADGTVTLKGVASGATLPTDLKIPCYNPDGKMITDIGSSALSSKKLTSVHMGDNIKTIGSSAFKSNKLETLELGNGVETIGKAAFAYNSELTEVTLPDSLKLLDGSWSSDGAFYNNAKLQKVIFGSGIETIGDGAFYNCRKLATVDLSRATNLKTIGMYAFYYNGSLTEVDLSNNNSSLLTIGQSAFSNNKIATLNISGTEVSIGNDAFSSNLINELNINSKITSLGVNAFKNNQLPDNQAFIMGRDANGNETNVLTSYGGANRNNITIPENVESITASFSSLSLTGTLDTGNKITTIGSQAFMTNTLDKVIIRNNIKTIGDYAFQSNPIGTLELGNGVESIGKAAFAYNSELTEVTLPDSLKLLDGSWSSDGAFYNNAKLQKVIFGSGIETIGDGAFYNCRKLATADLSRATNLKTIGMYAFYYNGSLTEVDLSNNNSSLLTIGQSAFSNNKIATLNISGTEVSIGNDAFSSNLINELNINSKITSLGVNAFKNNQLPDNQAFIMGRDANGNETNVLTSYGGANRNNITIPENVESITASFSSLSLTGTLDTGNKITTIGSQAFMTNTLDKVIIRNNIKTIGDYAFQSNPIGTLELGNGVESIGKAAFAYNSELTEVTLPDSLKLLDGSWSSDGAFYNNAKLQKVIFGSGIETIGDGAFYNCRKLATVDLSRATNLKTIGMYVFYYNGSLTEVDLSNSPLLVSIGNSAFNNNILTSVKLNTTSLTNIGSNTFAGNPDLASITLIGKVEGDTSLTLGSSWNGTCTNIIYQ